MASPLIGIPQRYWKLMPPFVAVARASWSMIKPSRSSARLAYAWRRLGLVASAMQNANAAWELFLGFFQAGEGLRKLPPCARRRIFIRIDDLGS